MSANMIIFVLTAAFLGGKLLDRLSVVLLLSVSGLMIILIGGIGILRHVPIIDLILLCIAAATSMEIGYFMGLVRSRFSERFREYISSL